ncbi:MAG: ethanolamine utilization protein EutN [Ignavibacteria bacterium]|nr:ethanolamine utilization protein EutN [Ignavibacteria bacterium]
MFFGKVIGTIWATRKDESLVGKKLLFVQPLNSKLEKNGDAIIAVDTIGVGVAEHIFYITSREATVPLTNSQTPIDAAIVGKLDRVDLEK